MPINIYRQQGYSGILRDNIILYSYSESLIDIRLLYLFSINLGKKFKSGQA